MSEVDDFTKYCRTIVRHMRQNPGKYPTFHRIMNAMADDESIDVLVLGIGCLCVYYFDRNYVIAYAASQIEKCAIQGAITAELLFVQPGETVH